MFKKSWKNTRKKSFKKSLCFVFLIGFLCPYQTFSEAGNPYPYDYSPWSSYAPSIEQCSLGQFTLPDPAAITLLLIRSQNVSSISPEAQIQINSALANAMMTVQIYGWTDKKLCHVVYKSSRQEQNADNIGLGPLGFDCNFTQDEIIVLAGIARKLAANQIALNGEDPASKVKSKACRSLMENVPPPPVTNGNIPVYFINP